MLRPTVKMPLGRHACLATADVERARDHLSGLFWPHSLSLREDGDAIRFRHNATNFGSISMNALRYGREVAMRVAPSDSAYLVKFTLAGKSEVCQQGTKFDSNAGQVCVMNPAGRIDVRLAADHNQLTLRIDGARLHRFLEIELGDHPRRPIQFAACARACHGEASGLARLIGTLCDDRIRGPVGLRGDTVVRHLEDAVFALLLNELPHNYSERLQMQAPPDHAIVRRVRDYVTHHVGDVFSVEEIAQAAGTSTRTLQAVFRQHLGMTPMAYVRERRLELAHEALIAEPQRSITDIAFAFGFSHAGRFSRYYRERYGETPRASRLH